MTSTNYLHYNRYIETQEALMSKLQYLTHTCFGQTYNDVQDLSDEQKSEIIILNNLATAYMFTNDFNFRQAVDLAHINLPEDYVDNTELGFLLEMAQKSGDPMDIINTVRNYVSYNKIIYQ